MIMEVDTSTNGDPVVQSVRENGENSSALQGSEHVAEVNSHQTEMFEKLSQDPEVRVKNQHKSEKDLTNEDKFDSLKELFIQSPLKFITQFGKHLEAEQLKCFDEFKDSGVTTYLVQLRKNLTVAKVQLKNRRYAALQKLVDTTEYFTEEEMQRRNPILFDQLIGKFQSKEEKQAFLQRSCQAASSSTTPLTDLLMAHMNRNEEGESYRRLDQEKQKADEDEADAEYADNDENHDDGDEMDDGRYNTPRNTGTGQGGEDEGEEIEDDEKELLKEEFYTTMYQHFLDGKDVDFDYASVDNNEEYDVGENLDQDEEEKYFDDEEPCEIEGDSDNGVPDEMFNPPVRCKDIESKIQTLSVEPKEVVVHSENLISEEDELDAYMKTIELELRRKK